MYFMLAVETLIVFALGLFVMFLIATTYTFVMSLVSGFAFVFAKATVSLVIAFILHSTTPLNDNALISYGIWAAISLAVCFLICILPRIDCSMDFICRIAVTIFLTKALVDTLSQILGLELSQTGDTIVTFATRLAVIILSGKSLLQRLQEKNLRKFKNIAVVTIDRVISSLIYGIALYLLLINQLPISFPGWIFPVSVGVFAVAAFVVDHIYISKKL